MSKLNIKYLGIVISEKMIQTEPTTSAWRASLVVFLSSRNAAKLSKLDTRRPTMARLFALGNFPLTTRQRENKSLLRFVTGVNFPLSVNFSHIQFKCILIQPSTWVYIRTTILTVALYFIGNPKGVTITYKQFMAQLAALCMSLYVSLIIFNCSIYMYVTITVILQIYN